MAYGIVYKTTNLINNKIYIGQTITKRNYYIGSGDKIIYAILKYGKQNFVKEVLEEGFSQEHLNERERFWIKKLKSQDSEIGYNIEDGGSNRPFTMPWSEERRKAQSKRMSGSLNPSCKFGGGMKGKKHSKEILEKMSRKMKGKKRSIQGCQNISNSKKRENHPMYGKNFTVKRKSKISIGIKKFNKEHAINHIGINNSMFGKDHTELSKEKMRRKALNRKPYTLICSVCGISHTVKAVNRYNKYTCSKDCWGVYKEKEVSNVF